MLESNKLNAPALLATAGSVAELVTGLKENKSDMPNSTISLSEHETAEPYRTCNQCNGTFPITDFPLYRSQPGRRRQCQDCRLEWRRGYYQRRKKTAAGERDKATNNAISRRLRLEVIAAYGGACECCGETEINLLNVDHIFNDGAEDRRQFMAGAKLYYYLRRNGFPRDRYQLLCISCNAGKAKYGDCPHRLNAPSIVAMARVPAGQKAA